MSAYISVTFHPSSSHSFSLSFDRSLFSHLDIFLACSQAGGAVVCLVDSLMVAVKAYEGAEATNSLLTGYHPSSHQCVHESSLFFLRCVQTRKWLMRFTCFTEFVSYASNNHVIHLSERNTHSLPIPASSEEGGLPFLSVTTYSWYNHHYCTVSFVKVQEMLENLTTLCLCS